PNARRFRSQDVRASPSRPSGGEGGDRSHQASHGRRPCHDARRSRCGGKGGDSRRRRASRRDGRIAASVRRRAPHRRARPRDRALAGGHGRERGGRHHPGGTSGASGEAGHTIGGLLATGWTGPLRMRYGSPRDFLIGIRVALPDGRLASAGGRVVKNVSGYDLMKLHLGAMGSLGVIVAASFKVFPQPLHDVTVESHDGWPAVDAVLAAPVAPSAIELFSDGRVIARFFGSPDAVNSTVKTLGWPGTDREAWTQHSHRAADRWARIAVPRTKLREVLNALPQGSRWWASPGVGIAHWAFDDEAAVITARTFAESAGGSLVLMFAPDQVKEKVGAWGSPPPTLEVMRRLKEAFDPKHILNPGRYVI
ncbi:MAG: FAD-binding protein, partial [Chloroflexi bacterium]